MATYCLYDGYTTTKAKPFYTKQNILKYFNNQTGSIDKFSKDNYMFVRFNAAIPLYTDVAEDVIDRYVDISILVAIRYLNGPISACVFYYVQNFFAA